MSIDQAEETVLRRMRESGATLEDMADALGVTSRSVSRKLASLGLVDRSEEARRMFEDGATKAEMAEALGMTYAQVSGLLRKLGLKRTLADAGKLRRERVVGKSIVDMGASRDYCSEWRRPEGGLFEPVWVDGDGPLSRRYRQQLAERGYCKEG